MLNGCLKNDLRLLVMGESGGMSKVDREGELIVAESAASRCLRVKGFGGMFPEGARGSCRYMKEDSGSCEARWEEWVVNATGEKNRRFQRRGTVDGVVQSFGRTCTPSVKRGR